MYGTELALSPATTKSSMPTSLGACSDAAGDVRAVPATRPPPRRPPAMPPDSVLRLARDRGPVGRWAHEPPSRRAIPVRPNPCVATAAARGPARRLPAAATDRLGERADVYLAADAAEPPSASPGADDGDGDAPRRDRRAARGPGDAGPRRAAGLRRRRAGGVDRPRARGDVGGCLGHPARAPRRRLARRRAVLPRRRATRRACALAHHRRAHPGRRARRSPSSRRSWRRSPSWRASGSCTCGSPRATSSSTTWGVRGSSGLGALRRLPADGAERVALLRSGHEALAGLLDEVASAVVPARALARTGRVPARAPRHAALRSVRDRRRTTLFAAADPEPVRGIEARARRCTSRAHRAAAAARDGLRRAGAGARATGRVRRAAAAPRRAGARPRRPRRPGRGGRRRGSGRRRSAADPRGRAWSGSIAGRRRAGGRRRARADADAGSSGRRRRRRRRAGAVGPASSEASGSGERRSDASGSVARDDGSGSDAAPADEDPGRSPSVREHADEDAASAARRLLDRRAECFETLDLRCLDAVAQPGSPIETADRRALSEARDGAAAPVTRFDPATIEVTAEMGAAVLVRAAAPGQRTGLAPHGEGRGRMALARGRVD